MGCPGGTYALLDFPGICTNAEICRRKDLLREALLLDNDHENQNYTLIENNTTTGMIVLQYNPPGTLPWRRRNQIGLPVEKVCGPRRTNRSHHGRGQQTY